MERESRGSKQLINVYVENGHSNTMLYHLSTYVVFISEGYEALELSSCNLCSFTQPPSGRRRMRTCFADVFFPSTKTMRQPFSGTAERNFMKLSPNDGGEM